MTTAATQARAASNGHAAPEHDQFPVDSFKDAARHLRRPFTRAAVKFKVQATWSTGGLIVSYIDARLVVERLNLIVPHLWFDEYQPLEGGRLLCRLTVDGITRHDIGDGYQGKGLYSDALKRAAVKFGVGVSLYAIPQTMLNVSDGHLKTKRIGSKETLLLTPSGEARCRELYDAWLTTVGKEAFGEPLSHGDVEGAQGDTEAPEEIVTPDEPAEPSPPLSLEQAQKIVTAADEAGVLDKLQLAASHAFGDDVGSCDTVEDAILALSALNTAQAAKVEIWVAKKAKAAQHA